MDYEDLMAEEHIWPWIDDENYEEDYYEGYLCEDEDDWEDEEY